MFLVVPLLFLGSAPALADGGRPTLAVLTLAAKNGAKPDTAEGHDHRTDQEPAQVRACPVHPAAPTPWDGGSS